MKRLLLFVICLLLVACSSPEVESDIEQDDPQLVATEAAPTAEPTAEPTEQATAVPTEEPTAEPTEAPVEEPTTEPTVTPAEEPTQEAAAETRSMAGLVVSDQTVRSGIVAIDEAQSDGPGWLVIHNGSDGAPGPVLGFAPLHDGVNQQVGVPITTADAAETLFAMVHVDAGVVGQYEFPGADGPATDADGNVIVLPLAADYVDESSATTIEYALPGTEVYPEGIAYDSQSNSFFAGSTADGALFRGNLSDGSVEIWSEGGADGRILAIGLALDEANRRLWVAGGPAQLVFVYDVDSGELIRRYDLEPVDASFINDVTLDSSGNAYLTDSGASRLLRIAADAQGVADSAEVVLDPAAAGVPYDFAFNLNGIAITPDDAYALLAHSSEPGLYRYDLQTNEVIKIETDQPVGGDGIVLDGPMLYTVMSGGVTIVRLSEDFSSGEVVDQISDESFRTPTTVAQVGDRLLVINAQFGARGSGNPVLPFTVSSVQIPQ